MQCGGVAGLTVDMAMFPMDTIKTRLQSKQGFWKAGGFTRIYAGIAPAAAASAPSGVLRVLGALYRDLITATLQCMQSQG